MVHNFDKYSVDALTTGDTPYDYGMKKASICSLTLKMGL